MDERGIATADAASTARSGTAKVGAKAEALAKVRAAFGHLEDFSLRSVEAREGNPGDEALVLALSVSRDFPLPGGGMLSAATSFEVSADPRRLLALPEQKIAERLHAEVLEPGFFETFEDDGGQASFLSFLAGTGLLDAAGFARAPEISSGPGDREPRSDGEGTR